MTQLIRSPKSTVCSIGRSRLLMSLISGSLAIGGTWMLAVPGQAQGQAPDGQLQAEAVSEESEDTATPIPVLLPPSPYPPAPLSSSPETSQVPGRVPPELSGGQMRTAQTVDRYQLSRGDRILVTVFDSEEYTGEHQLFADGTISLPLVGSLRLQGLTLAEAEALIERRLSRVLRRPFTTVRLLEERPINLAITGEVYSPGAYTISLGDAEDIPTLTKAIQLAQGVRLTADIRNIQVLRSNPQTNQVDEVLEADLWRLLEQGDLSQNIVLEDGDSIIIPEALEVDYSEVNVLAYANISPEAMTVNVVGEVEAPGAIQVKPSTPLHQAILSAGGFTNRARKKRVMLVRLNPDGTVLEQEIEIDFSRSIDTDVNPPLRPFDTVVVGRSNFARVTDVLGRALSPITQVLGVLRIFGL